MNRHVNAIAGRLSLRPPQRRSLEILDRITELAPPNNGGQALIICLFELRHPSRSRLMGDPAKYVKLLQIAFPTPPGDPAVLSVSFH